MKKTALIGLLFVIYTALIGLLFAIVGVIANENDHTLIVPSRHLKIQTTVDSCQPANTLVVNSDYHETLLKDNNRTHAVSLLKHI